MNNLIGDSQHGFRNKRNCLKRLLDFFAHVIDTYDTDNNKEVDLVYLERLKLKVNAHDIQCDAATWIRNWIAGRRLRVCINQSDSNWAPVASGVPQGCAFVPLLLLIYIKLQNLQTIPNVSTQLETLMT